MAEAVRWCCRANATPNPTFTLPDMFSSKGQAMYVMR